MFVGHYAVAFALKGKEPKASLGMLFIAVQFVDILFFPFALMGIEHLEFVEGYTQVNDFKMEFPFTHGLVASVIWGALFYLIYYLTAKKNAVRKHQVAIVMGLAVLSHWFIDLIVHSPDLPLVYGPPKLGFGLWYYKLPTFIVEAVLLFLGWAYYMKRTQPKKPWGIYLSYIFFIFLIAVNYINFYLLPSTEDLQGLTISALFSYFLLAGLAYLMDKGRKANA